MGGTLQPINLKKDYKNRDILDYVRWNADQQAIENVANKLINSTEDGDSGADNISMTAIQSISTATSLQSFLEALAAMLISAQAAAKLGAVAPDADISGNNIQAILNSLKTYIDSALNTLSDNMDSMNASLVGNINERVKSADLAKTDGTGGSNIVGSQSIIGVQGNTVYQQLLGLKQLIDDIEAGVLPDGYIDNTKLADDIKIGSLAALATAVKTSVVNALNEIVGNIGDLSALSTTDKTKIVNALNEVLGNVGDKANLTTVNKTSLVGAVNEVKNAVDEHKSENATSAHKDKNIAVVDANNHFTGTTLNAVLDELFTFANDGKTGIANAVTAKGVAASPSDTFATLATKIGQIQTGKRWASGTGLHVSPFTVSGLNFTPGVIIIEINTSSDKYRRFVYYNNTKDSYFNDVSYDKSNIWIEDANFSVVYGGFTVIFKYLFTGKSLYWYAVE